MDQEEMKSVSEECSSIGSDGEEMDVDSGMGKCCAFE